MGLRTWPSCGAGLIVPAVLARSTPGALAQAADPANENEVRVNFEDRPQSGPLPFNAAIRKEQLAVAA